VQNPPRSSRESVLVELARCAYAYRPEAPFQLVSGDKSPDYVDCRAALSRPALLSAVSLLFLGEIRCQLTAVGGLTIGADPLAIGVSLHSERVGLDGGLRWFSIRKGDRFHGAGGRIAGFVQPGDQVLVVDDVATTGGSTLQAIRACRAEKLRVQQVLVLVDRQVGGLQVIQQELDLERDGVARASALFTLDEVRTEWQRQRSAEMPVHSTLA
jgi:orotate phosphoribosyltransferase